MAKQIDCHDCHNYGGPTGLASDGDICGTCNGTKLARCWYCREAATLLSDDEALCSKCLAATMAANHDSKAIPSLVDYTPQQIRLMSEGVRFLDGYTTKRMQAITMAELVKVYDEVGPSPANRRGVRS